MSYWVEGNDQWSECSNNDFEIWYRHKGHKCLKPVIEENCDEGYTFFSWNDKCYRFVDEQGTSTWLESLDFCLRDGGNLASIHDFQTNIFRCDSISIKGLGGLWLDIKFDLSLEL